MEKITMPGVASAILREGGVLSPPAKVPETAGILKLKVGRGLLGGIFFAAG
jgi:hypothetical protein